MNESITMKCRGGISALSAFFNGYGASVAIDLSMEVKVSRVNFHRSRNDDAVDGTLQILAEKFEVKDAFSVHISSSIPRGRGLKSSSALTLGMVAGFLRLNDIRLRDEELLGLCAEISIRNGTSSTGAYDDLCSSYYGGMCYTSNTERKLISRRPADRGKHVLVAYRKGRRSSAAVDLDKMQKYSQNADAIRSLIGEGKFYEAMVLNGNLLGLIYGQDDDLIRHFLSTGALYSAQCGKGPAVFAIFNSEEDLRNSKESMQRGIGVTLKKTLFSNSTMEIK